MPEAEVEEGRPSRRRAATVAARAIDAGRCDSADDSSTESVQARRSKVPRAANTAREAHRVSSERAAATRERERQRKQNIRDAARTTVTLRVCFRHVYRVWTRHTKLTVLNFTL